MENVKKKGDAAGIPIYCSFDEIVPFEKLKPNPKNPNQHPEDQIELLAKIIKAQGWRAPVTVSTLSGMIVRGHGRYMAAKLIGCPVPVDHQHYDSEADELADLVADNRIAELAEIDNKMLADIFKDIDAEGIDVEITGYSKSEYDDIFASLSEDVKEETELSEEYTKKVPKIQYVVTGETPEIHELFDKFKYDQLVSDIETDPSISEEEKEFLKLAATRHIVFDYRNIAEYYAAASPEMQRLMEDSALVIIDIKDAIENGYTKLKQGILDTVHYGELGENET